MIGKGEGEKFFARPCGEGGGRRPFFYGLRESKSRGGGKNVSGGGNYRLWNIAS